MAEQLMKYSEAVKKFDPVIGLETHVELSTNTKLFCPAPISFGAEPNTELTPVSLGLPGSLPVINEAAVDYAIKLGLAPARTRMWAAPTAASRAPTIRSSTTTARVCRSSRS